jgi:hypothetical protein
MFHGFANIPATSARFQKMGTAQGKVLIMWFDVSKYREIRIFVAMRTPRIVWGFASFLFLCPGLLFAQGMSVDSILPRIDSELHNPALGGQLSTLIPNYADARVWGLAIGDFTNDSLPDLAISIYDHGRVGNTVHVYFFENEDNKKLVQRFVKEISFIESPIEVGLTVEGSVVTITRRTGSEHWEQEGYSIEFGDVTLIDRFETSQENVASSTSAGTPRELGHEVYRNYENLRSRESYFTGSSGDALLSESFATIPAYGRSRDIYPGYGHIFSDSSKDFILSGMGLRRDASDLSIRSMQAAYNDDYLYISIRVRDDYVIGGQPNIEANDRVSFWFDTKYTDDRLNRDRRLLSMEGGFPTFRTTLDSLVSNITFALPAHPGKVTQITYSSVNPLNALQQDGLKNVMAIMSYDTGAGVVNGYHLTLRIPFSFLGFETNPEHAYETPVHFASQEDTSALTSMAGVINAATLGFTALVYDVDDPSHPNEVTIQGTSKYEEGNPASLGMLVLEPSAQYYGEVHATYLDKLRSGMTSAGY